MTPLFTLRNAGARGPLGPVFEGLDWEVRLGRVTTILGPAGCGKSTLLRGLTGRPLPLGWELSGDWRYQGRDLHGGNPLFAPLAAIAWVPQSRVGSTKDATMVARWRRAFRSGASAVLLDEPTTGAFPEENAELVIRLRAHVPHSSAVVVTHDLAFAREIADEICLLCAGRIIARGNARSFFQSPPDELSARFVRDGNCWPAPAPGPLLPSHFHWVLPGKLAGMGRPGLLADAQADLEAVAAAGIRLIVSLTEEPLPATALRPLGLTGRHFPVPDMGVPAINPTASLCREILNVITGGGAVVLHCHAGMGRTGTLLASVLVWLGSSAEDAVAEVRAVAQGYIQNRTQIEFVRRFATAVGPGPSLRAKEDE